MLEWVAVPFSRGSSQPRDGTQVSRTVGGFFTLEPPGMVFKRVVMLHGIPGWGSNQDTWAWGVSPRVILLFPLL